MPAKTMHPSRASFITEARRLGSDENYADSKSVTGRLSRDLARGMLTARGWKIETRTAARGRGTYEVYLTPDGQLIWELDEALTIEITAQALEAAQA